MSLNCWFVADEPDGPAELLQSGSRAQGDADHGSGPGGQRVHRDGHVHVAGGEAAPVDAAALRARHDLRPPGERTGLHAAAPGPAHFSRPAHCRKWLPSSPF